MTLWGGRFAQGPDQVTWEFTVSHADRRLLEVDVQGSIAHVAGLTAAGLLGRDEANLLTGGLGQILSEAQTGSFEWSEGDEDVHTAVERRLGELVGASAGKLRTGRSRNDQVALDLRLWMRGAAREAEAGIVAMVGSLVEAARRGGRLGGALPHPPPAGSSGTPGPRAAGPRLAAAARRRPFPGCPRPHRSITSRGCCRRRDSAPPGPGHPGSATRSAPGVRQLPGRRGLA